MTTAADTATFNYTVVATKSAATDSGWTVTGTITVTNPNVYTVTNVRSSEQGVDNGGVCTLKSTGAVGTLVQGQTASVDYTCTLRGGAGSGGRNEHGERDVDAPGLR